MYQHKELLAAVANYYSGKITEHGVSAKGVDWNSESSQEMRFEILLKLIEVDSDFTLLDYGCGYGAMLGFLNNKFSNFLYTGLDISNEMLVKAASLFPAGEKVNWISSAEENVYDYSVASGIFNVKLEQDETEWKKYIESTLIDLNSKSKKGFSFNMLTSWSDKEFMRDYLFYANPTFYFDFCKKYFSRYVALLHDYPLYEFTIVVNKKL